MAKKLPTLSGIKMGMDITDALDPLHPRYVAMVPLSLIEFAYYQRPRSKGHIKKICGCFKSYTTRPITLSYRDGKFWCVDGGHTLQAMLEKGCSTSAATVVTKLEYFEEANMFADLNSVPKKVGGWDKFKASRDGNNPVYAKILEVLTLHNLTTPLHPDVHKNSHADVTCCGAMLECFNKGGSPLLHKLCTVLNRAWRVEHGPANDRPMKSEAKVLDILRGLINFLNENPVLTDDNLVAVLKSIGPERLRSMANSMPSRGRIDHKQIKLALESVFKLSDRIAA